MIWLAFTLCLLLSLLYYRPSIVHSKDDVKNKLSLPNSVFWTWNDLEIHYVEVGEGVPIIVLHGFGSSLFSFLKLSEQLKGGVRMILVDLPGFGLSELPENYNGNLYDLYSRLILDLAGKLRLEKFGLMGNSMGGEIAWHVAADYTDKVDRLILIDSTGYDPQRKELTGALRLLNHRFIDRILERGIPRFITIRIAKGFYCDLSKLDTAYEMLCHDLLNRQGNISNLLAIIRLKRVYYENKISQVQCNTLILWGKQDTVVPYEHGIRFNSHIRNSILKIYTPCGHVPMIECTESVAKDILDFVRD